MKGIMSKEELVCVYEREEGSGVRIKDLCENEGY